MSRRSLSALLGALALATVVLAVAVGRDAASPRRVARRAASAVAPSPAPSPSPGPSLEVESLRNIFRYADERPAALEDEVDLAPAAEPDLAPLPPPPTGPRLVGIVRRSGRLMAALAVDGEVELAGPGESAAGVLVVSVDEDSVRVRDGQGAESELELP